jgi:hypothetical protein
MGEIMNLREVVETIAILNRDHTIYAAEPWTCESEASVEREPDDGQLPQKASVRGLTYFLEVFIAQEFLAGWSAAQPTSPTIDEQCRRLIHYAQNDA